MYDNPKTYSMNEIGDILAKYCIKNNISQSEFVRHSVIKNMADAETDKQLKARLEILSKQIKAEWASNRLKVVMKSLFFAKNVANKLAQAVVVCHTKKHLIDLIDAYVEIAIIFEDKKSIRMLKNFKTGLKTKKEFDAIKAEFRNFIISRQYSRGVKYATTKD